jgi:hypothetical protein
VTVEEPAPHRHWRRDDREAARPWPASGAPDHVTVVRGDEVAYPSARAAAIALVRAGVPPSTTWVRAAPSR